MKTKRPQSSPIANSPVRRPEAVDVIGAQSGLDVVEEQQAETSWFQGLVERAGLSGTSDDDSDDEQGRVERVAAPRHADHASMRGRENRNRGQLPLVLQNTPAEVVGATVVTRVGGRLYEEPGRASSRIRDSVEVEIRDVQVHQAEVETSQVEEAGARDWFLAVGVWPDGTQFELWGTFGSFGSADELGSEMCSETEIAVNPGWSWWKRTVARTWNEKGGYIDTNRGGIPLAVAVAVLATESAGAATGARALPIVRFENHKFRSNTDGLPVTWGKDNPEVFGRHFRAPHRQFSHEVNFTGSDEPGAWSAFHGSQEMEWAAFELASSLSDRETAARCISIGAGQIMGFNAIQQGYESAASMLDEMTGSAKANVGGVFTFIRSSPGAEEAIARGDYFEFAARYNGRGSAAEYEQYIETNIEYFHQMSDEFLGGIR
jgi:hypothetical protein